MNPILKVDHIKLKLDELEIIDDVSLEIKKGELVSIIGPLGSGKTNFLKIIGGLIKPTSGTVTLDNKIVRGVSTKINFILQKKNLLPWLTVEQNISLPFKIKNQLNVNLKNKLDEVLKLLHLTKFRNYYPNHLSGGMEQLTALARAFLTESEILLLDEPFASLDSLSREKMNQEILKIWQLKKKTIILVTHSVEEAIYLSDRIVVFSKRPAKIRNIFKVDFPRPRDQTILLSDKFRKLVLEIKEAMS